MNVDISSELLFPVPEALSPRLAWMKKHGIITFHHRPGHNCPPTWFAGFQAWHPTLKGVAFCATETAEHDDSRIGEGETEEDALISLMGCWDARKVNMHLWNEEAGP